MREERQMLGQMIDQVHQQQTELKELQNQITEKLDTHNQSLLAIQNSQEAIQNSKEQSEYTKNNLVKEINDNNQQSIDTLKEDIKTQSSLNRPNDEKKGFFARLFNL